MKRQCLRLTKMSIIVEKDGRAQVLRITGGSYAKAVSFRDTDWGRTAFNRCIRRNFPTLNLFIARQVHR